MKLTIVITSTRPGRVGKAVADWFEGYAKDHAKEHAPHLELAVADLKEIDLPLYDEPRHPMLQDYEHAHTRRWSEIVEQSDAFVFVLPEYNHTAPPTFFNALDYLYKEWNFKPAGFVSYGGISGGIRAVETAKHTVSTMEMVPVKQQVLIPMVGEHLHDGVFHPTDMHTQSAQTLVEMIGRWATALKTMR